MYAQLNGSSMERQERRPATFYKVMAAGTVACRS